MRRGPHAKRPGSVVAHDIEMRVLAESSLDQRDGRACLCSSRVTGPRWRSSGVVRACSGLWLHRDTSLVTTGRCRRLASISYPMWLKMVVCCVECVCFCSGFVRVVVFASARYVPMLFLLI
jgi:hypothetical protein